MEGVRPRLFVQAAERFVRARFIIPFDQMPDHILAVVAELGVDDPVVIIGSLVLVLARWEFASPEEVAERFGHGVSTIFQTAEFPHEYSDRLHVDRIFKHADDWDARTASACGIFLLAKLRAVGCGPGTARVDLAYPFLLAERIRWCTPVIATRIAEVVRGMAASLQMEWTNGTAREALYSYYLY